MILLCSTSPKCHCDLWKLQV